MIAHTTRPLLQARLTMCRHGLPLAVVERSPLGDGAELRPAELRALAAALLRAAEDAEGRPLTHRGRRLADAVRTYGPE